jgi:hypothetical protein
MGWTGTRKPRDIAAWLRQTLTWETPERRNRCLDVALLDRAREGYAAVETHDKATGAQHVWAAVFLFRHAPNAGSGETFLYKDMTEHMGPVAANCPERILDQLTDTDSESARAWRARCRARHARRAAARGLPAGTVVRFDRPIALCDGLSGTRFAYLRGSTFYALNAAGEPASLVRISGWRTRDDWQTDGQVTLPAASSAIRLTARRLRRA